MNNKFKTQQERVIYMEAFCDQIQAALDSEDQVREQLEELQTEIQEIREYYTGGEWLEDYDAEQKDAFPKNLKRGILSEDTLYDLICEVDEVLNLEESL